MKKIMLLVGLVMICVCVSACGKENSNEKNENKRSLTIINELDEVINEVRVIVGEGTEIERMRKQNPETESFSIKIPKTYEKYDTFTVVVLDRYGIMYKKTVSDVALKGRTEVKITKEDYVEQKGDLWRKLEDLFN